MKALPHCNGSKVMVKVKDCLEMQVKGQGKKKNRTIERHYYKEYTWNMKAPPLMIQRLWLRLKVIKMYVKGH